MKKYKKLRYGIEDLMSNTEFGNTGITPSGALTTAGSVVDVFDNGNSFGRKTKGSKIASGALKGAGTGASIGAAFGGVGAPIGAGVGAIVGGVSGLVSANREKRQENEYLTDMNNQSIMNAKNVNRLKPMNYNYYESGGLIKRADGSYSKRGLWDNVRANKGSGKEPTKQMLVQERKINKKALGGPIPRKLNVANSDATRTRFSRDQVYLDPNKAKQDYDAGRESMKTLAGGIPFVGSGLDVADIAKNINDGNYGDAAIGVGGMALGAVPLGGIAKMGIKAIAKPIGKAIRTVGDNAEAYKLVRNNFSTDNPVKATDILRPKRFNSKIDHLIDEQNTFKRGVYVNRSKDPNLVVDGRFKITKKEFTKEHHIDPDLQSDEDLAKTFATKIPRNPKGGTAFGSGVLYSSNSDLTAQGYTYGQGYIATIKNNTDKYKGLSNSNKIKMLDKDIVRGSIDEFSPRQVLIDNDYPSYKSVRSHDRINEKKAALSDKVFMRKDALWNKTMQPAKDALDNANHTLPDNLMSRYQRMRVNSELNKLAKTDPIIAEKVSRIKALSPDKKINRLMAAGSLGVDTSISDSIISRVYNKFEPHRKKAIDLFNQQEKVFNEEAKPLVEKFDRIQSSLSNRLPHPNLKLPIVKEKMPLAFEHDVDLKNNYAHRTIAKDSGLSVSKLDKIDDNNRWVSRAHFGERSDGFFPKKRNEWDNPGKTTGQLISEDLGFGKSYDKFRNTVNPIVKWKDDYKYNWKAQRNVMLGGIGATSLPMGYGMITGLNNFAKNSEVSRENDRNSLLNKRKNQQSDSLMRAEYNALPRQKRTFKLGGDLKKLDKGGPIPLKRNVMNSDVTNTTRPFNPLQIDQNRLASLQNRYSQTPTPVLQSQQSASNTAKSAIRGIEGKANIDNRQNMVRTGALALSPIPVVGQIANTASTIANSAVDLVQGDYKDVALDLGLGAIGNARNLANSSRNVGKGLNEFGQRVGTYGHITANYQNNPLSVSNLFNQKGFNNATQSFVDRNNRVVRGVSVDKEQLQRSSNNLKREEGLVGLNNKSREEIADTFLTNIPKVSRGGDYDGKFRLYNSNSRGTGSTYARENGFLGLLEDGSGSGSLHQQVREQTKRGVIDTDKSLNVNPKTVKQIKRELIAEGVNYPERLSGSRKEYMSALKQLDELSTTNRKFSDKEIRSLFPQEEVGSKLANRVLNDNGKKYIQSFNNQSGYAHRVYNNTKGLSVKQRELVTSSGNDYSMGTPDNDLFVPLRNKANGIPLPALTSNQKFGALTGAGVGSLGAVGNVLRNNYDTDNYVGNDRKNQMMDSTVANNPGMSRSNALKLLKKDGKLTKKAFGGELDDPIKKPILLDEVTVKAKRLKKVNGDRLLNSVFGTPKVKGFSTPYIPSIAKPLAGVDFNNGMTNPKQFGSSFSDDIMPEQLKRDSSNTGKMGSPIINYRNAEEGKYDFLKLLPRTRLANFAFGGNVPEIKPMNIRPMSNQTLDARVNRRYDNYYNLEKRAPQVQKPIQQGFGDIQPMRGSDAVQDLDYHDIDRRGNIATKMGEGMQRYKERPELLSSQPQDVAIRDGYNYAQRHAKAKGYGNLASRIKTPIFNSRLDGGVGGQYHLDDGLTENPNGFAEIDTKAGKNIGTYSSHETRHGVQNMMNSERYGTDQSREAIQQHYAKLKSRTKPSDGTAYGDYLREDIEEDARLMQMGYDSGQDPTKEFNRWNWMKKTAFNKPQSFKDLRKVMSRRDIFKSAHDVFAFGGHLAGKPVNGGAVKPLSKNAGLIVGPNHEQGGVKFPTKGVELEGGETTDKNFVFSKSLGFADQHLPLAQLEGHAEQSGNKRLKLNVRNQINGLKRQQETLKDSLGIEDGAMKNSGGLIEDSPNVRVANGLPARKSFNEKVVDGIDTPHMLSMIPLGGNGNERYSDLIEKRRLNPKHPFSKISKGVSDGIGTVGNIVLDPLNKLKFIGGAAKSAFKTPNMISTYNAFSNSTVGALKGLGLTSDVEDIKGYSKKKHGGSLKKMEDGGLIDAESMLPTDSQDDYEPPVIKVPERRMATFANPVSNNFNNPVNQNFGSNVNPSPTGNDWLTQYKNKIGAIESGNNYFVKAHNKSSARGRYQFLTGTLKQMGINPNDYNSNPETQERAMDAYTMDNVPAAKRLEQQTGIPFTKHLAGMHLEGRGGYTNKLRKGMLNTATGGSSKNLTTKSYLANI